MTDDPTDDDALAQAYNLGLALEKSGDLDAAAAAYRRVLTIDPQDHGGVAIRLAAMGRGPVPDAAPDAYVSTLFDQNAAAFDDMLVEQLGYAVPILVREVLQAEAPGPYGAMLDLGCGTGLTGGALDDMAHRIVGVDLAEQMLDEAYDRDCYDALFVGEAVQFLTETDDGPWDLVTATDILPYIGGLEGLFAAVRAVTEPGAVWIFSSETLPSAAFAGRDFTVGPKHRFAHDQAYVNRALAAAGFALGSERQITVRYDDGVPVPGYLTMAHAA